MIKVKYTCGIPTMASCVTTEVTPNSQSSLIEESCLSQEEVNTDVYKQLETIQDLLDFTTLTSCETLPTIKTPITLLQNLYDIICNQKDTITEMQQQILTLEEQVTLIQENNCP